MKTTLPKLTTKAQKNFNAYIRQRDQELGCISCGAEVQHAGHYFSVGHYSALRFDEQNVHGQCLRCNNFLHGNLINYRFGLIARYGEDYTTRLENKSFVRFRKWSRQEIEEIILKYK